MARRRTSSPAPKTDPQESGAADFSAFRGEEATTAEDAAARLAAKYEALKEDPPHRPDNPQSEVAEDDAPEIVETSAGQAEPDATLTDDLPDIDLDDIESEPAAAATVADRIRVPLSDGQQVELTAQDVRDSLMMRADYTAKTQELAAQRQQLEQERLSVQNLQASLAQMQEQGGVPPMPPAEMLRDDHELYNPVRYIELERMHRDAKEKMEAARQDTEHAREAQMGQWREQNNAKIFERIPEWQDQSRQVSEMQALRQHMLGVGFTAAEFDESFGKGVVDYRIAKMARDSMILQQALAKKNGGGNGMAKKRVVARAVNVKSQPASGSSTETRLQKGVDDALRDLQQRRSLDPIKDASALVFARIAANRGKQSRA